MKPTQLTVSPCNQNGTKPSTDIMYKSAFNSSIASINRRDNALFHWYGLFTEPDTAKNKDRIVRENSFSVQGLDGP